MTPGQRSLLELLADGRFHSGETLAGRLGCSRAAVWKRLSALRELPGIEVEAITGKGYRLRQPLELLDADWLVPRFEAFGCALEVCDVVESTNDLAVAAAVDGRAGPAAWLAEHQTAGRGRRGRCWYSPYGRNLCLSLLRPFDLPLHRLSGLSVAVGTALALALETLGLEAPRLKWPNDLWHGEGKLGGVLIEARGEAEGPVHAVIGLGLNLDLGEALPDWIDQPVTDLARAGVRVSRNRVAEAMGRAMVEACDRFEAHGLAPFLDDWETRALHRGRQVELRAPGRCWRGRLLGLDPDGGLRLHTEQGERVFHGGELGLRPIEDR